MTFIEPEVELWKVQGEQNIDDIWGHIARCARVCYQSEKKNNNETEEEFVKRVILKNKDAEANHGSVLEHGTIYLVGPTSKLIKYKLNKKAYEYSEVYTDVLHGETYITTNLRVIYENNYWNDLEYLVAKPQDIYHVPRYTFSIITDIGVTREGNRHRANSPSEESTRYCNYKEDGKLGGVKYIKLPWIDNKEYNNHNDKINLSVKDISTADNPLTVYFSTLFYISSAYNALIRLGWTPQMAREILPLNTKSQVVYTASVFAWRHFLNLRSYGLSGKPHPCMKIIADKIKDILLYL